MKFDHNKLLYTCFLFFFTLTAVGLGSILSDYDGSILIRNIIICCISMGVVLVVIIQSILHGEFDSGNQFQSKRLIITYMICITLVLILAVLSPDRLPDEILFLFPFLAISVLFTLFSCFSVGYILYIHLMVFTVLLYTSDMEWTMNTMLLFLLSGLIGCVLVRSSKKTYPIWRMTGIMIGQYIVMFFAFILLNSKDIIRMLIWLGFSIMIQALFLIAILYITEKNLVCRYAHQYEQLNQSEHELLMRLKEKDQDAYLHAVHTAYLCEKAATCLELDAQLSKAGGYYHKIGIIHAKDYYEKSIEIGKEYQFPQPLMDLIDQCSDKQDQPKQKEAIIVLMSELIVKTITYMYHKDPEQKINYQKIIQAVFQKQIEEGFLQKSNMTLNELFKLKEYYQSEDLYYDFLR